MKLIDEFSDDQFDKIF